MLTRKELREKVENSNLPYTLLKVWNKRADLTEKFIEPETTVWHNMTLLDWAAKYGVNEHPELAKLSVVQNKRKELGLG